MLVGAGVEFWIFKCNPDYYRLADRMQDPRTDITWLVQQHRSEIAAGHTAFIWRTGDDRGIVGVLRVDSSPQVLPDDDDPFDIGETEQSDYRVRATIIDRHFFLGRATLRATTGLENLSVFRRGRIQMGTNFPVTSSEGRTLLDLIAASKAS